MRVIGKDEVRRRRRWRRRRRRSLQKSLGWGSAERHGRRGGGWCREPKHASTGRR